MTTASAQIIIHLSVVPVANLAAVSMVTNLSVKDALRECVRLVELGALNQITPGVYSFAR